MDVKPKPISVMSFNLRGAQEGDGVNAWSNRKDLNVRVIRECAPDMIGLQEAQFGNLEAYAAHLPEYAYLLGPQYNNEHPYCYTSLCWRRDRFDVTGSGGWWLSPSPWIHSGGWGTDCYRAAAWVGLRCRATGLEFVHVNTHLDHISEHARVEQTRLLLRLAATCGRPGGPVVVTGDFNCNPDSEAYGLFLEAGFEDTWPAAGQEDGPEVYTFHAFEGKRQEPCGRIDWIMTFDPAGVLGVVSARIVPSQEPPLYPSDHYPVMAELAPDLS